MKARVKATGEIVEVQEEYDLRDAMVEVFYSNVENSFDIYEREELDFNIEDENNPDYWEKLKHQYAGMAMQGMLANPDLLEVVTEKKGLTKKEYADKVACIADIYATALVEKLKEK